MTQASMLVELARDAELFHTPTEEPFATVKVDGHLETLPIRSRAFRAWLRRRYWEACEEPVGGRAMSDANDMLADRALFGGATIDVGVRIARLGDSVYVDLANAEWEVVEIGQSGWRVTTDSGVRFRRPSTMAALPRPLRGGSFDALRPFVNLADDDGWRLFVGTLVAACRAAGPYLILILHGEQGSAKSTTARIVRALVDPSHSPLRTQPRDEQDLLIAAHNNWVVAFDNISRLQPWLSDALCRLSTGGGLGKRQLYTDQDEIVLDAQRPQVLTGISELATRGDLLDRAIILEQPTIDDADRRAEADFWAQFEAVRPQILGALFDAVSAALGNEASIKLRQMPRMADPTHWVTAAEPALGWPQGTFLAAYARNRREGHSLALEAALISAPLQRLAKTGDWQGTASDLLRRLTEIADEDVTRQRGWPKNARALTEALKRVAPSLRTLGIDWRRLERTGSARPHSIRIVGGTTVTTDTSVTGNVNSGDVPTPDAVVDRQAPPMTVTFDGARGDGGDGRDGPTPRLRSPDRDAHGPVPLEPSADEEITTWTA